MVEDILNSPADIVIGEKSYQLEFDNKAYAMVEKLLEKGIYKVFKAFVNEENLLFEDCIKIICAGLLKHHDKKEIEEAKKALEDDIALVTMNYHVLKSAFAIPLSVPKSVLENQSKKTVKKKIKKKK